MILLTIILSLAVIAGIFLLIVFTNTFYIVQQAEAIVVERLGKYHRTMYPGFHILVPMVDNPRTVVWTHIRESEHKKYQRYTRSTYRIDLRESVYDFPKQSVITRDNVTIEINALIYYHVTDAKAAVYEVANLPEAIEKLTQTTLRNVIGSLDLDETLISRDQINTKLRLILDEAADKWGVKVTRVELQEVNPPVDIRHAMEKQMRAERDRRATILESEGKKRAAILEAEGVQESQILRARGQAESQLIQAQAEANARLQLAKAEAQALEYIKDIVPAGDPVPYMVAQQYIKALSHMTQGKDDKLVVLPIEATSLMGSITALKKVFEQV